MNRPEFFAATNYVRTEMPPDFSYTILDKELRAPTEDALMELIISRTEYESETRRERFQSIELIPRTDLMAYTVNLWVEKR